ncbi:hypothetical protein B0H13DRAFT_1936651 [Mycena leptocephala]|nr:hypothetical protein B0H13DRAFT_1936651 [Mycena leptocephala]
MTSVICPAPVVRVEPQRVVVHLDIRGKRKVFESRRELIRQGKVSTRRMGGRGHLGTTNTGTHRDTRGTCDGIPQRRHRRGISYTAGVKPTRRSAHCQAAKKEEKRNGQGEDAHSPLGGPSRVAEAVPNWEDFRNQTFIKDDITVSAGWTTTSTNNNNSLFGNVLALGGDLALWVTLPATDDSLKDPLDPEVLQKLDRKYGLMAWGKFRNFINERVKETKESVELGSSDVEPGPSKRHRSPPAASEEDEEPKKKKKKHQSKKEDVEAREGKGRGRQRPRPRQRSLRASPRMTWTTTARGRVYMCCAKPASATDAQSYKSSPWLMQRCVGRERMESGVAADALHGFQLYKSHTVYPGPLQNFTLNVELTIVAPSSPKFINNAKTPKRGNQNVKRLMGPL